MRTAAAAGLTAGILLFSACGSTTLEATTPPSLTRPPTGQSPTPVTESPTPSFEPEQVESKPGGAADFVTQTGKGRLEITRYAWHNQGAEAGSLPPEAAYLVLDIKLSCSDGTCYHNPAAFRVRGPDDATSTFTGGSDGYGPILGSGTAAKGEEVSGVVSFDIAQSPVTVEYLDEFDQVAGKIDIK